jgi:hypothetical protein
MECLASWLCTYSVTVICYVVKINMKRNSLWELDTLSKPLYNSVQKMVQLNFTVYIFYWNTFFNFRLVVFGLPSTWLVNFLPYMVRAQEELVTQANTLYIPFRYECCLTLWYIFKQNCLSWEKYISVPHPRTRIFAWTHSYLYLWNGANNIVFW